MTRSSDSFSTVLPIVNRDDWGYIVRDIETIIILVLLTFNFIPQRSHTTKNIPVSNTKLMLGLWVGFISSHLIVDKLFPVNPRAVTGPPKMRLLLVARAGK